ncbi:MAG: NUDIX hydrolase, partial [Patescibacteria group bacterium]|nr:NUDIX hydrolase [Patescibacteria group bacterium]
MPGGKIEYSEDLNHINETPQEAARREVREETLFQLSAEEIRNSWKFGFNYFDSGHRLVIFLLEISTSDERINLISETSDEVIQVRWVPIDKLRSKPEYANKTEHLT